MAFNKIQAVSMTDIFVKEIKKMILTGELKINEQLPPEREIAKEMNVSLAVVHGGITRLCEMGFLRVIQRKGVYVDDYLKNGSIRTLVEILDFSDHSIDEDLLDLIVHIRDSIEQIIFRKACDNNSPDTIESLINNLEQTKATENIDELAQLNYEFIHTVAINSGSPYYAMLVQTFRDMYYYFGKYSMMNHVYTKDWVYNYETSLVEIIQSGDIEKMKLLISDYISSWSNAFKKSSKFKVNNQ